MINSKLQIAAQIVVLLAAMSLTTNAQEDPSAKVTGTVIIPMEVATFSSRTLEIRLYVYDPLLADAAAKLVERITKPKFPHTNGKKTAI